jgi:type IV pilus assembly protein PilY1
MLAAGEMAMAANTSPDSLNYQNSPITSSGRTVPRVLLVMSKDHKLFQQAYNNFSDMDNDGLPDTGFNPSVIYFGYFDSRSCYKYSRAVLGGEDKAKIDEYFSFEQATIDDESQATLDSKRPDSVKKAGIKAARAVEFSTGQKIGICNYPHSTQGGLYSGNWLNFITATRMDVIRKILYGGHRRIDTNQQTQLQSSLVPRDAHTWGTDVLADNRWAEESRNTKYFDISKFTPFPKPIEGTAHFFVRVRNKSSNDGSLHFPLIQFILNAGGDVWKAKVQGSTNSTGGRYFDWALNQSPNPSTNDTLTSAAQKRITELVVQVNVCDKSKFTAGDSCRAYPNGNLKPSGLLQQNGEHGQMLFGLMTGTFDKRLSGFDAKDGPGEYTRRKGGVIRAHINNLTGSINMQTGIFMKDGLIQSIDGLIIAGSPTYGGTYTTATSWGNPVGELLYEGVRYFNRLTEQSLNQSSIQPTKDYVPIKPERDSFPDMNLTVISNWNAVPSIPSAECAKPIIILIAEAESDYDGDQGVNTIGGLVGKPLNKFSEAVQDNLVNTFSMNHYLQLITGIEGFGQGGKKFYWSADPGFGSKDMYSSTAHQKDQMIWGDCSPKTISSLASVNGICPNRSSFEGTYSASAVAYFAHTHDFSPPDSEAMGIDIYSVTLTPTFPALNFPLYDSDGDIARRIEILPVAMSETDVYTNYNRLLEVLNYYVLDWRTDSRGTPYSVTVRVNYEAQAIAYSTQDFGSNWDADIIVEHVFELLSNQKTSKTGDIVYDMSDVKDPADKKDKGYHIGDWISGALKVKGGKYWTFKDPESGSPFVIEPGEVAGLINGQWKVAIHIDKRMMTGYTISGSTHDGIYMDTGRSQYVGGPAIPKLGTPPSCNWPKGYGVDSETANGTGCFTDIHAIHHPLGTPDDIKEKVWRTFEFDPDPTKAGNYLPNPMYLAAKYGGFTDYNLNGVPDNGEWEGEDGNPKTYFRPTNVSELPVKLEAVFREIARSISTSTASAASIDTIMGGGMSVQSIYYPVYTNPDKPNQQVRWAGSIYGLFLDKWGNLREDTDHNGILDMVNGDAEKGDYVVTFNSLSHKNTDPPKCYEFGDYVSRCFDKFGNNSLELMPDGRRHPSVASNAPYLAVHRIEALFDTGSWLAHLDSLKIAAGPRPFGTPASGADGRRRILYEAPATSSRPKPEIAVFWYGNQEELEKLMLHPNYLESLPGGTDRSQTARNLINWICGIEVSGWRSRVVEDPWLQDGGEVVLRLGDVINSKPILVSSPSSAFDMLYGDAGYATFVAQQSGRRQMVYFGANDGMLHAVNVGFPTTLSQGKISFELDDGKGAVPHERGAELWAFIPASVLPHLRWLPDPYYSHSYFVDQKPLVNDMQINGEWKTVLIGGLRLGGRPIETPNPASAGAEHYFSEVFALDITDPETEPVLLWRYSTKELGLTVGLPSTIHSDGKWYIVIPTGPVTDTPVSAAESKNGAAYVQFGSDSPYNGYSNQKARLIVLDAETGAPHPATMVPGFLTVSESGSFFNNPFLPVAQIRQENWSNHALYYGLTVSRNPADSTDTGAVYRLMTVDGSGQPLPVSAWELRRLIDTDRPVTGAVNSTYDSHHNLWVVFGTGKVWGTDDVLPCSGMATSVCEQNHVQYFYGIKEELNPEGYMTFSDRTYDSSRILDVSGYKVYANGAISGVASTPNLPNSDTGYTTFSTVSSLLKTSSLIGYKRALNIGTVIYPAQHHAYEMVLTQPKFVLLSNGRSLSAFTSFEPRAGGCGDSGEGYLYLVDTFTGLPDPSTAHLFGDYSQGNPDDPKNPPSSVSGAVAVGQGKPTEAYVITSSAGTTVSASAEDASTVSIFIGVSDLPASRLLSWKEALNTGFVLTAEQMIQGLK